MAVYEGRWDCSYCGSQNRGSSKFCVKCGASRGKDVEFYLPENAEEIYRMEELEKANAGPDWNCDSCGAANASIDNFCSNCGDPRQSTDITRQVNEYDVNNTPSTGADSARIAKEKESARLDEAYERAGGSVRKPSNILKLLIPALIIVGLLAFVINLFIPKEVYLTVEGHSWVRESNIENYREVRESDWSIPSGGKLVNSKKEIHHYDKVLDHYETKTRQVRVQVGTEQYVVGKRDKGNGYFEDIYGTRPVYENRTETYQEPVYRDVPVYGTKYTYDIWKWVVDKTLTTSGNDKNAYWAKYTPENEKWRLKNISGKYTLHIADKKGKKYDKTIDYEKWLKYNPGQQIKAKKSPFGIEIVEEGLK